MSTLNILSALVFLVWGLCEQAKHKIALHKLRIELAKLELERAIQDDRVLQRYRNTPPPLPIRVTPRAFPQFNQYSK